MSIENAIELLLNDKIQDKKTFKSVDKIIRDNIHLLANKKAIINKLDSLKYKMLYKL